MQAFNSLSDDLALPVILAAPCSFDKVLAMLPPQMHPLGVHASYPSISATSSLDLDCASCTTAAATAALRVFAEKLGTKVLKVKNFGLYRGDNYSEGACSSALMLAGQSELSSAHFNGFLLSPEYLERLLDAMAHNLNLVSLEATHFRTFRSLNRPPRPADAAGSHQVLAEGLSRLTTLHSLTLKEISFVHKAYAHLPLALKSLTALTELRLDTCITNAQVHASYLSVLQQLETLEISYAVNTDEEAVEFAACLSGLTALRSLILAGRMVSFNLKDYSRIIAA